ncbi:MAG TPA: antibiotic biosynthesis monooxygenase [Thermomicrobiales bacterium]|nr:antibiotic biosynthesis monooxygenase [Thermomicrobiales bacterium]
MGTDVAWLLELAVDSGEVETVRPLMTEMVDSARAEAGTLSYAWYISDDASAVALYERFVDDDAALAHLTTVGETFAQRFLAAMTPTRCTVFGAPSDAVRQALAIFNPTYLAVFGGFPAR